MQALVVQDAGKPVSEEVLNSITMDALAAEIRRRGGTPGRWAAACTIIPEYMIFKQDCQLCCTLLPHIWHADAAG